MKKILLCGIVSAIFAQAATPVFASDISFVSGIDQSAFKSLSKEAGAAIGYRNLAPAESLGITGFDIGVEVSAVSIDKSSSYWKSAFNNDSPSFLTIPRLRARKGLPFGIDVGAMYSYVPNSNVRLYGAELSKSILDGGIATPAVGVRATYTKLTGVGDLGLQTYGIDASISKGFLFLTPYAGAGMMWVHSEAKGKLESLSQSAGVNLKNETLAIPRFFGGLKVSPFPLVGVTVEAEYAERPIYSLKAALSF